MEKVIQALQEKKNALVESPTGTGKTLCILCSTLAWREHYIQSLAPAGAQASQSQSSEEDRNIPPDGTGTRSEIAFPKAPRIVYATRTHSQLAQVMKELKRTDYKPKTCLLGSRAQLCIHPRVSQIKGNSSLQNALCRSLVGKHTCKFYENVQDEHKKDPELTTSICNIEDLIRLGRYHDACPYYLSRSLQQAADIVFMPYNYLVDPSIRKSLSIDLEGAIVIFDEAHNLESVCRDASSFDLKVSDLLLCARELQRSIDMASSGHGILAEPGEIEGLTKLKTAVLHLEKQLQSVPLDSSGGLTKSGSWLYEVLASVGITADTKDRVLELLDQATSTLSADTDGLVAHKSSALEALRDNLRLVFRETTTVGQTVEAFRVHLHNETPRGRGAMAGLEAKEERILSFWCLDAGIAMEELVTTAKELKIEFPIRLENPHVVSPSQVWIGVVSRGTSGHPLNSSYKTRDATEYKSALGNSIVNFARIVPHGLLVFFPSYSVMMTCLEAWKQPPALPSAGSATNTTSTIWDRLCRHKQPVLEPRESYQLHAAMQDYYSKVQDPNSNGGVFFAVCRGKVSEGLDFADENGRGVVIAGMPYPSLTDPKVALRRQYLDEYAAAMGARQEAGSTTKFLSGREWYTQQAARAINQAIGRVIRHRFDYGAIILCDERFASSDVQQQLSAWLRLHIKVFSNFGEAAMSLTRFFKNIDKVVAAAKADPAPSAPDPPVTAATDSSGGDLSAPTEPSAGATTTSTTTETKQAVADAGDAAHRKDTAIAFTKRAKTILAPEEYDKLRQLLVAVRENSLSIRDLIKEILGLFGSVEKFPLLEGFTLFVPAKLRKDFSGAVAEKRKELFPPTSLTPEADAAMRPPPDAVATTITTVIANTEPNTLPNPSSPVCSTSTQPQPAAQQLPTSVPFAPPRPRQPPASIATTSASKRTWDLVTGKETNMAVKRPRTIASPPTTSSCTEPMELRIDPPSTDTASNTPSGLLCTICREQATSPFTSKCGHICCYVCWVEWLKQKQECPVCRNQVRMKHLTKLYFA